MLMPSCLWTGSTSTYLLSTSWQDTLLLERPSRTIVCHVPRAARGTHSPRKVTSWRVGGECPSWPSLKATARSCPSGVALSLVELLSSEAEQRFGDAPVLGTCLTQRENFVLSHVPGTALIKVPEDWSPPPSSAACGAIAFVYLKTERRRRRPKE